MDKTSGRMVRGIRGMASVYATPPTSSALLPSLSRQCVPLLSSLPLHHLPTGSLFKRAQPLVCCPHRLRTSSMPHSCLDRPNSSSTTSTVSQRTSFLIVRRSRLVAPHCHLFMSPMAHPSQHHRVHTSTNARRQPPSCCCEHQRCDCHDSSDDDSTTRPMGATRHNGEDDKDKTNEGNTTTTTTQRSQ